MSGKTSDGGEAAKRSLMAAADERAKLIDRMREAEEKQAKTAAALAEAVAVLQGMRGGSAWLMMPKSLTKRAEAVIQAAKEQPPTEAKS